MRSSQRESYVVGVYTLEPRVRAPSIFARLVTPVRLGPWFGIERVVDRQTNFCRVTIEGQNGRKHTLQVEPEFLDPLMAEKVVRYINACAVAQILTGFAQTPNGGLKDD